jgi:hypothetical protein
MVPMAMSSTECRQEIKNRLIACDEIERRYYGGLVIGADLGMYKRLLQEIDALESYLDNPSLSQEQPSHLAVSGRVGGGRRQWRRHHSSQQPAFVAGACTAGA